MACEWSEKCNIGEAKPSSSSRRITVEVVVMCVDCYSVGQQASLDATCMSGRCHRGSGPHWRQVEWVGGGGEGGNEWHAVVEEKPWR